MCDTSAGVSLGLGQSLGLENTSGIRVASSYLGGIRKERKQSPGGVGGVMRTGLKAGGPPLATVARGRAQRGPTGGRRQNGGSALGVRSREAVERARPTRARVATPCLHAMPRTVFASPFDPSNIPTIDCRIHVPMCQQAPHACVHASGAHMLKFFWIRVPCAMPISPWSAVRTMSVLSVRPAASRVLSRLTCRAAGAPEMCVLRAVWWGKCAASAW